MKAAVIRDFREGPCYDDFALPASRDGVPVQVLAAALAAHALRRFRAALRQQQRPAAGARHRRRRPGRRRASRLFSRGGRCPRNDGGAHACARGARRSAARGRERLHHRRRDVARDLLLGRAHEARRDPKRAERARARRDRNVGTARRANREAPRRGSGRGRGARRASARTRRKEGR